MKSLRTSLAILFAAALMVTIMAVPAFATVYYQDSDVAAYYTQGAESEYSTTNAVTVTLRIQSRKYSSDYSSSHIDESFQVTIPASATSRAVTVSQVLYKAKTDNSGLYFRDYSGNNLTSTSPYCYQIRYGGKTYAPVPDGHTYYWNGWMFMVNGKFPILSGTPATTTSDTETGTAQGRAINTTYVKNGDVITMFYNDSNSYSAAADVLRIKSASYDSVSDKFSVYVQASRNWYVDTGLTEAVWHIMNYDMIQSATVKIYNSSGEEVAYGTTDATGLAYLSATKTITSGNYTVKTTLKHKYKSYLGSGYYFVNTTHTEETLTI